MLVGTTLMEITIMVALQLTIATVTMIVQAISNVVTLMVNDNVPILIIQEVLALPIVALVLDSK